MDNLDVAGVLEVKRDKNGPMLTKVSLRPDAEEVRHELSKQTLFGTIVNDLDCLEMWWWKFRLQFDTWFKWLGFHAWTVNWNCDTAAVTVTTTSLSSSCPPINLLQCDQPPTLCLRQLHLLSDTRAVILGPHRPSFRASINLMSLSCLFTIFKPVTRIFVVYFERN